MLPHYGFCLQRGIRPGIHVTGLPGFSPGIAVKKKGHIVDVPLLYRNNTGFDNPGHRYPLFSAGSCLWRHRCGWWCAGDLDHGTYHVSKYEYPCEVREIDEIG